MGRVFGLRIFTAHQSGPCLIGRTPEDPLVQDSLNHHRHHAVMLPEESSYYFTIARWIEEVKVSSSRTCVECGGAVHSALGSGVRGTDRDWIAKMFDYINRVY